MDPNYKFAIFVISIPMAGLLYCGLGIAAAIHFPEVRENSLLAGGLFALVPFAIAAAIWLRLAAKAYNKG